MNNFLIVGQPRTGTNSVIKMLKNFHGVKDFTINNKLHGTAKWLASKNTVAKMHTEREYKQYKKIIKDVRQKISCVYFTKTRSSLLEHFISLLCVSVTRSDEHNVLGKPDYPVSNDVCYGLITNFISEYKNMEQYIKQYKSYRWSSRKNIDVFQGFKYRENKYSKNLTNDYFEDVKLIRNFINEELHRNRLQAK